MTIMQVRTVSSPSIISRVNLLGGTSHWTYNEPSTMYNQTLVTYNYYTGSGSMSIRDIAQTIMRGR
jgi:hypothetical protein